MDLYLFQLINNLAGRWLILDYLGIFFAKYLAYLLIIFVFFVFFKKWKIIFQIFLAGILARFGLVELLRWIFQRPRPFQEIEVNLLLDPVWQPAFPSGHAAFFFALSTVIYFFNKKAGLLFFLASLLIGLFRVFCGVHWPTDILAGMAVGIFSGWLIFKIFRRL
jgi:membrane-associated phospholipid phosphatase